MSDPRTLSEQALTSGDIADLLRVGVPVHLQNCSFIGVDCAEADLAEWRFEKCDLRRANLDHCILEDVVFSGCRSVEASFRFARFSQVAFKDNDLSNTSFKHSQFADVAFEGCKMLGVDFTDTTTNELAFKECNLGLSQMQKITLRDAILTAVNFDQADLTCGDFRNALFDECSLRESNVSEANFQGADLRNSDLGGLQMSDARRFKGAIISKRQAADLLGQLGLKVL